MVLLTANMIEGTLNSWCGDETLVE